MEPSNEPIEHDALLQHAAFVERLAAFLVGPAAADAADLVQDTYLTALRRRPADPERLRPWLRTVMFGLVRSGRRSSFRRRKTEKLAADNESLEQKEGPLERLEIQQLVVRAVLDLPEHYRSTLVQRYYSNRSHAQIAKAEGVALETVTTRLRRAKELLRERLERNPGLSGSLQHALAPFLPPPATRSLPVPWIAGFTLAALAGAVTLVLLAVRSCTAPSPVPPQRHPLDQDLEYRFETTLASLGQDVTYVGPDGTSSVDLDLTVDVLQELTISDRILGTTPEGVRLDRSFDRLRLQSRAYGTIGVDGSSSPVDRAHQHVGRLEGDRRTLEVSAIDELSLRLDGLVPARSRAVGDSWTIEPKAMAALFAPLDVLAPPSPISSADTVQGTHAHGPEQWFSALTRGTVNASVTGMRVVGGERLAEVRLDLVLGDQIDQLRPDALLATPADAGVRMNGMIASARFTGRGTLVWNLDRRRVMSLEVEGVLALDLSLDAIIPATNGEAHVTRNSQLSGPAKLSILSK